MIHSHRKTAYILFIFCAISLTVSVSAQDKGAASGKGVKPVENRLPELKDVDLFGDVEKGKGKIEESAKENIKEKEPQAKLDVPTDPELKKAVASIKEIYSEKYKSSDAKARKDLAAELAAEAMKKEHPAAVRYAFFSEALENSAYSGDVGRIIPLIKDIEKVFTVNRIELAEKNLASCDKYQKAISDPGALAAAYIDCYSWCMDADLYDDAAKNLNSASICAKKANSAELMNETRDLNKDLLLIRKDYALAAASFEKLKTVPDDPAANLAVGKFYCFSRNNWDKGVPMIAKGQDEKLKQLASVDMEDPEDAAEMTELADGWWNLSDDKDYRLMQNNLRERACYWYERILPLLASLDKIKIEKKIELANSAAGVKRSSTNLPKGAVLAFSFEKNTLISRGAGSVLSDLSGQKNDGRIHGVKFVKGVAGDCAEFNGKDSYIEVKDSKTLNLEGNMTVSMWLDPVDFGGRRNPFNKCYGGEGTMTIETSGVINYFYGSTGKDIEGGYTGVNSSKALLPGKWNHAVLVRDMKNAKLFWYLNGELTLETPLEIPNVKASNANILIGRGYAGFYQGMIDEFAVFAKALSEKEVKDLYNLGKKGQSF